VYLHLRGKGASREKCKTETYATATVNILHEKSKKSLRRREAKNIKQRDKNLEKGEKKKQASIKDE
jgi:hypothetical protein